jgi:hypothetical protein
LINDVEDLLEREHYRQMLARKLGIDERVLRQVTPSANPRRRRVVQSSGQAHTPPPAQAGRAERLGLAAVMQGGSDASERRRADFLRQCMSYPRLINAVDDKLVLNDLAPLSVDDFTRLDDRALWRMLPRTGDGWAVADPADLWDSFDEEFLQARAKTLLSLPGTPESEVDRLPDRLVLSVLDWRQEKVKGLIVEVEQLFVETQAQNDPEMLEMVSQQLRELPLQLLSINRARKAMSAVGRRNSGGRPARSRGKRPIEGAKGD